MGRFRIVFRCLIHILFGALQHAHGPEFGLTVDTSWISFCFILNNDFFNKLPQCYFISYPLSQVKLAIQYMRRVIQKKANFDIAELNAIKVKYIVIPYLT